MRRYEIVHIFARRLGAKVGRVQAILSKLQENGIVSSPGEAKGHPLDMDEPEIIRLLISLLGEAGIATGPLAATTFGALATEEGERFDDFLLHLLFYSPPEVVRHLMVRQSPPGVSVIVDGLHILFGDPQSRTSASPARIVSGETLAAIAAELQGQTPAQADTAAELARLNLSLGRAA